MKPIRYIALHVKKYLTGFLHLVYPKICLHCGNSDITKFHVLCSSCYAQLPFTDFFEIENNNVDKIFWGRLPLGQSGAALFWRRDDGLHHLRGAERPGGPRAHEPPAGVQRL